MSKFTDFPRNTKQAYIKSCAQAAREAAIRAQQTEQAYQEHTPTQNTDELLEAMERKSWEAEIGIVVQRFHKVKVAA